MKQQFSLTVPVAFIIFKRLDTAREVFARIREARPPKLYLISDAPRDGREEEAQAVERVRSYVEGRIDWECELHKDYAVQNMGCRKRVSSGISWVLSQEEMAIILEDDCLPDSSFFPFCQELLLRYRDDTRIGMVSGHKMVPSYRAGESYLYSLHPSIWGWATWRRAWQLYDVNLGLWPRLREGDRLKLLYGSNKLYRQKYRNYERVYSQGFDTWDFQWDCIRAANSMLGIVPACNLIRNIGIGPEATHTTSKVKKSIGKLEQMQFPLRHPEYVLRDYEYDRQYAGQATKGSAARRIRALIGQLIQRRRSGN